MTTLTRDLRRLLENTVRAARRVAEDGAGKSLEQLGVAYAKAPAHLSPAQAKLRNALRVHGRHVGDVRNHSPGAQTIGRLTVEMAYEHWHRMLFARFLAENELLIEPDSGMAISLEECQELAREQAEDWLALASRYAQTMLPQIFRVGDPVLEVSLPPETRSQLDDLLKGLPHEVFRADDSLGWVYQFWQADNKEAINRSEKKIGAEELPAVTQLFTEDYMVWFLLHNTLGAWWAGKRLAQQPELATAATSEAELRAACAVGGIEWTYLRFLREDDQPWRPAAGSFDGWPKAAKDITLLDPSMGSGHFLVFALPILAALRAQEEGLPPQGAIEAVLRDNLYGLEIDPRCTQIAAFNLALAAWKRIGHRKLPTLNLACSGLSLGVSKEEWLKLAERASAELPVAPERDLLGTKQDNLFSDATRRGFERLYELFVKAPVLGSLIQPRLGGDLVEKGFADLEPLLAKVLAKPESEELSEMAVAAQGLAKAAQILAGQFTLVTTNVPYLGIRKQGETLKEFCSTAFPDAKEDLATVFISRISKWCSNTSMAIVAPQNWLYLYRYRHYRKRTLEEHELCLIARLGEGGFQSTEAAGAFVALTVVHTRAPNNTSAICAIDASGPRKVEEKSAHVALGTVKVVSQESQLRNPDWRISLEDPTDIDLLNEHVTTAQGIKTGDDPLWVRCVWELSPTPSHWQFYQTSPDRIDHYTGRSLIVDWRTEGTGMVRPRLDSPVVGKRGIVAGVMRQISVTLYDGELHDSAATPIVPADPAHLPALWAFCSSPYYNKAIREIEQKIAVTTDTLAKVPFDLAHWQSVASGTYPSGLPKPQSNDPTQWLFNGHPKDSHSPLHVAVARLVGYRWPRQTGSSFPDCPALAPDGLESHEDDDGIVPLTAIKGEAGAAERVVSLLSSAYGPEWSAVKQIKLLSEVGSKGPLLEDWLLDQFFEQHCALFHQRPFVWHVWDGLRDGFNVLVNYHKLAASNGEGKRLLEKLTHTYLGDWITEQRRASDAGLEGADARLAAAEHLKNELEKILAGEPPYDLFVRWKPLAEQAIGWEPDINDGVRMNIRPFMTARPFGARAKNACILRVTPKIKWDKDRGKEPERAKQDFPWFWAWDESTPDFAGGTAFDGNRWNDLHYTPKAKRAARERAKRNA